MKFASVVVVALAAILVSSSGSAQNLKGAAPEWRAGAKTPMIPGRSDADRWHKVKELIPRVIGMTRANVTDVLGKCSDQHQLGDGKQLWTYQITEYAKTDKPKYVCMLLTVLFENDRAVKCSIEPLWPAAPTQ